MCNRFPDPSKLKYLWRCVAGAKASCEILLDYDEVRYHLLLEYNFDVPDSKENKYLQKVYDLFETVIEGGNDIVGDGEDGMELLDDAAFDCAEVFWPFVKKHSDDVGEVGTSASQESKYRTSSVVKMQVRTVDGSLQVFEHAREHQLRLDPIANPFPDLRTFQQTEVLRMDAIFDEIFEVVIDDAKYFLKNIYSTASEESFLRELTILRNMPSHPNVISLSGVVVTEDGRIEGLLTPHISGFSLQSVKSASDWQRNLWKREIAEAILWLHKRDCVWGDAKPRNIMIDANTNHVVLVDFGGGTTSGWVDQDKLNTRDGDLQGMGRILEFIDAITAA